MYRLTFLILGVFVWGCASIDTTRQAPSAADARQTFSAPWADVVRATRQSLPAMGLHLRADQEVDGNTQLLIAERCGRGNGWGELVRVRLHDNGRGVEARVFTEPRFLPDFSADWDLSPDLFWQIDQRLHTPAALAAADRVSGSN
jgi:hypothetical protein